MKLRFEVFTVVVWQPALPEKSVKIDFLGNVIQTYVTGKRFPDEWLFRADFDHESHNKLADGREFNWRPEISSDPGCVVSDNLKSVPPRRNDKDFVKSKVLGEYADYNDGWTIGSYADSETVKQN